MANGLAIALFALLTAGCGTVSQILVPPAENTPKSSTFSFADGRSLESKNHVDAQEGKNFRFGDAKITPSPNVLVEQTLRRANDTLKGAKVILRDFRLSLLRTPIARSPMADFNAHMYGVVGALMTSFLDASRSPDFGSASVEIELNGHVIRANASANVSKFDSAEGLAAVLSQLMEQLVTRVNEPPDPPKPAGPVAAAEPATPAAPPNPAEPANTQPSNMDDTKKE